HKEREVMLLQKGIRQKMSEHFTKAQREAVLREQMRAIQEELGEGRNMVYEELAKKVSEAEMPEEVFNVAQDELRRLENLNPISPEYQVIRNYLEWLSDMPWQKSTPDQIDIPRA